jgi:hypothetical protein
MKRKAYERNRRLAGQTQQSIYKRKRIKKMSKQVDEELVKIRESIIKEIPYIDIKPYSHNIIGLQLSVIDKKYGHDEVVKTIKEFELDKKGWSL